jgi:hypothetical protein
MTGKKEPAMEASGRGGRNEPVQSSRLSVVMEIP